MLKRGKGFLDFEQYHDGSVYLIRARARKYNEVGED